MLLPMYVAQSLRAAVPARCRAGGDAPLLENPSKNALKSLPKVRRGWVSHARCSPALPVQSTTPHVQDLSGLTFTLVYSESVPTLDANVVLS